MNGCAAFILVTSLFVMQNGGRQGSEVMISNKVLSKQNTPSLLRVNYPLYPE